MQNLKSDDMLSQEFHIIMQDGKVYRKFDAILKIGEMYPQCVCYLASKVAVSSWLTFIGI